MIMKNNKSAFCAIAVSAMLGMGAIEANAQQTRYEGTVTIHQRTAQRRVLTNLTFGE